MRLSDTWTHSMYNDYNNVKNVIVKYVKSIYNDYNLG